MQLIETPTFTRRVCRFLSDESYRLLQAELVRRPRAGAVIPRTGGLRKLRWRAEGEGKRGGTRVVYYWIGRQETILLLLIYRKGEQDKLTSEQRRVLRRIVEEELGHG